MLPAGALAVSVLRTARSPFAELGGCGGGGSQFGGAGLVQFGFGGVQSSDGALNGLLRGARFCWAVSPKTAGLAAVVPCRAASSLAAASAAACARVAACLVDPSRRGPFTVSVDALDPLAAFHLPEPDGQVLAGRGQDVRIESPDHISDDQLRTAQVMELAPRARLSDGESAVAVSGGEQDAVGAEFDGSIHSVCFLDS